MFIFGLVVHLVLCFPSHFPHNTELPHFTNHTLSCLTQPQLGNDFIKQSSDSAKERRHLGYKLKKKKIPNRLSKIIKYKTHCSASAPKSRNISVYKNKMAMRVNNYANCEHQPCSNSVCVVQTPIAHYFLFNTCQVFNTGSEFFKGSVVYWWSQQAVSSLPVFDR